MACAWQRGDLVKIHDFKTDLKWSHSKSDESWWQSVYQHFYPDLVRTVDYRNDRAAQAQGKDVDLILQGDYIIGIDEKVRREAWRDIALEVRHDHVDGHQWPGWVLKDSSCQFIAYASEPLRRCYLLPFRALRELVTKRRGFMEAAADRREAGFSWASSRNRDYLSINICVQPKWLHAQIPGGIWGYDWGRAEGLVL
jgi:hypothetical protein